MSVEASDVRTLYTVSTGPGNTYPQASPSASLGGFASHTPWTGGTLHDLFGPVTESDLAAGVVRHRCIYVANQNVEDTAFAVRAYLTGATPLGCEFDVGVDPTPASLVGQADAQAVRVTAETDVPAGVLFLTPAAYDSGLDLGDLLPGSGRAVWLRLTAQAGGTPPAVDEVTLAIAFP